METVVPPGLDGARADKAAAVLAGVSRSVARAWCDKEDVVVNGQPVRPADPVRTGDVLTHPAPPEATPLQPDPSVPFGVLYEDDELAVLDKPAGVVVHPGAGRSEATLAAGVLARWPHVEGVGEPGRWGLVHRLDRDTSGALLVALDTESHESLSRAMKERRVERTYLAAVAGDVPAETGTIDAPIRRDPQRPTRMTVDRSGRRARTHYRLVGELADGHQLLEVRLETGRTHQIRVHLSRIGLPVLGDRLYGWRGTGWQERIWLHAQRLAFDHPTSGTRLDVESPLPPELSASMA